MKALLLSLLVATSVSAKESFLDSVTREQWNLGKNRKIDVVWIEDDKFPKFTASIYFQDGALNDQHPGVAQTTFDLMTSGTSKETQREISEFFDFYGANLRHSVTHEYSIFTVQALTKDIKPVVGKVCELFKDAIYPDAELKSHVSRAKSRLKNLVTSHGGLADRIFRQISLAGSPYEYPVEGTLKSLDTMTSKILKERLASLNRARKTLYLAGPSDVKTIKNVLAENCE